MSFLHKYIGVLGGALTMTLGVLAIWGFVDVIFLDLAPRTEMFVTLGIMVVMFPLSIWRLRRIWVDEYVD